MSLAPRSIARALEQAFAPRLRIAPTHDGARALVFDHPAPAAAERAPLPAEAAPTPAPASLPDAMETPPSATDTPSGPRFIDNDSDVGFRRGLLQSARDGFDVYATDQPDRAQQLSSLAPVQDFQVQGDDGTVPRQGIALTPDVRSRVLGGDVAPQPASAPLTRMPDQSATLDRLRFAPADGESDGSGEVRTNSQGFQLKLPFQDRWGDPRFNDQDRGAALARLQEIRDTDWRKAPWADVVRAHDDIEEILAQHFYYEPSMTMASETERAAARNAIFKSTDYQPFHGGEIQAYMRERDLSPNQIQARLQSPSGIDLKYPYKPSILLPSADSFSGRDYGYGRPSDLNQVGDAAREAVESLAASRRAGVKDLLQWSNRAPKTLRGQPTPEVQPPDRGGFVSGVRRAVEQLPEAAFQRDPQALYNTLRKQRYVTAEELEQLDLRRHMTADGDKARFTRESLLQMVDDNRLRMIRRNNEFDPERPTRDYNFGGTRAFDGPRVPGRGRYFEERYAFPKRTRAGTEIPASEPDVSHWDQAGMWGAIRGSVRDVPKYGKGVLGEELQRDFYQGLNTGKRRSIPAAEYPAFKKAAREYNRRSYDLRDTIGTFVRHLRDMALDGAGTRETLNGELLRGDTAGLDRLVEEARGAPLARAEFVSSVEHYANIARSIVKDHPGLFSPEGHEKFATSSSVVAEPPMSNEASTRMLVRALFTRAAREGADWVAIPTGATNNRIQYNTWNSAAHYYDGELKNVMGRVARDLDQKLNVERVILPTPPLKRGAAVYMVRGLTPELRDRIKAQGLPMFGASEARADRMRSMRISGRSRVDSLTEAVRSSWGDVGGKLLDSGQMHVVPELQELPIEGFADIPRWVGAVHDYDSGKTYLSANQLDPGRVRELVLHEVGVHAGLEEMIGAPRYKALQRQVLGRIESARKNAKELMARGSTNTADADPGDLFWLSTAARVQKNYKPNDPRYADELLAYAAEGAERLLTDFPEDHPDRTWWQQILDTVRRWAATTLGIGDITARDVHTLAVASLQRMARKAGKEAGGAVGAVDASMVLRYARARGFEGEDPVAATRWLDDQGYFSPAIEAAKRFPQPAAKRADMVRWLESQPGVKKEELNTLFLDDWTEGDAGKQQATHAEFMQWLTDHRYGTLLDWRNADQTIRPSQDVGRVIPSPVGGGTALMDDKANVFGGSPKWGGYTYLRERPTNDHQLHPELSRGYFEAVVRPRDRSMMGAEWPGGHFSGGLAHVRGVRSATVDGKPSALLIEVQSDMNDKGSGPQRMDWRARQASNNRMLDALRQHSGEAAVDLFDRVQSEFSDARLVPARGVHPNGPQVIKSFNLDSSSPLGRIVRQHNDEAIAQSNTLGVGRGPSEAAFPEFAARGTLERSIDHRVPFESRWPEKAFTDVVRQLVRDGAERISWSTGDAVRAIPGMSGYRGNVYDERLPRWAQKWTGADVQKGPIDQAGRTPLSSGGFEEARMSAVDLAINDSMPSVFDGEGEPHVNAMGEEDNFVDRQNVVDAMGEFLQDRALEDDFFSEVLAGRVSLEDEQHMVTRLFMTGVEDGEWDEIIGPEGERQEGKVRAMEQWIRDFISRTVTELQAVKQNHNIDQPLLAHYFDVTPEVRDRILAPGSLFFGKTDPEFIHGGAGALDSEGKGGRSIFGETAAQQVLRGSPDYRTRKKPGAGKGLRDSGAAEALIGNSAAVGVGGTVAAVMGSEQDRDRRKAEYQAWLAGQRESQRAAEASRQRQEEIARLDHAISSHDWRQLPEPEKPMAEMTLSERAAYVQRAAHWAEGMTGVPADLVSELIARETAYTFLPDIRPMRDGKPVTQAMGFGQFMPDTWAGELQRSGASYHVDVAGRSRRDLAQDPAIQEMRGDPRFAAVMVAVHARGNILELQNELGRDPTSGEVYAAHFLGVSAAAKFIHDVERNLSPEQTATKYAAAARANPGVFMLHGEPLSARQIMAQFNQEFGRARIHIDPNANDAPEEAGETGDETAESEAGESGGR